MNPAEQRALFGRFHETARIILDAPRPSGTRMTEDDAMRTAILMEYGAAIGVCPLELHWLLGDVVSGLNRAVLAVHVQEMLGEAGRAREGRAHPRNRNAIFGVAGAKGPRRHARNPRRVRSPQSPAWVDTIVR